MFTIITQIRNEEKRLNDWVKYHNKIGIDEFIIFCDKSEDNSEEILKFLQKDFNIKIYQADQMGKYSNSKNPSAYASIDLSTRIENSYKKGLDISRINHVNDSDHWSIFTEVDEYIVPQTNIGLSEIIKLVPNDIHRIYISSYDFKCPFDLEKPVYEQTFMRWSNETRINGTARGVKGWFKNRGKSMVRTKDCITRKVSTHEIDNSPYYQNDDILKINHYRNFGEMQIYDFEDKKILDWL